MKKWLIALAVILLLSLPVCIALFGSGYLAFLNPDISADQVAAIHVTDGRTMGKTFEITDKETSVRSRIWSMTWVPPLDDTAPGTAGIIP